MFNIMHVGTDCYLFCLSTHKGNVYYRVHTINSDKTIDLLQFQIIVFNFYRFI